MKPLLITLLLISNLLAQENVLPAVIKHPEINHVFQGKGTNRCGVASALMALQRLTSINLQGQDLLPTFGAIYTAASANRRNATGPVQLLQILGFNVKRFGYVVSKDLTPASAREVALNKLKQDIIPELDKGSAVILYVPRGKSGRTHHAVFLTSFNHQNQNFTMNDPLKQNGSEISLAQLAFNWPVFHENSTLIFGIAYTSPPAKSPVLIDPPVDLELNIGEDNLARIILPAGVTIPKSNAEFHSQKFAETIEGAKVASASYHWEPKRKVDEVHGIPLWLKVKVAQGDPACLFFGKPDGGKKIVAVTGYRGGYKNFEGEMQITEIGDDGKLVKSWMKSAEVLQKGKSPRDCGGDSFYIIYPKKPLVEIATTEAKEINK